MNAFLKIGIDQFLVSLSLFVFSSIVISLTSFEEFARYSNMLAVLVFVQGLIQATIGEQLVYGWKASNSKTLSIVLVSLLVAVFFFVDFTRSNGTTLMILSIILVLLAAFYTASRSFLYAYNRQQGSVLSGIFSISLFIGSMIVIIFKIVDPAYLIIIVLASQVFAMTLTLILRGFPRIEYSNFKVIKSVQIKQISYQAILFLSSGLVFILAEKLNPELTGRYRKLLFFVYPVNQVISVLTLWLVPKLRTSLDDFKILAKKSIILNFLLTPLMIMLFYLVYNSFGVSLEFTLLELFLISTFGIYLIPNVLLSHYMKFRLEWRQLIVGHGLLAVLYIVSFIFASYKSNSTVSLIIIAIFYQTVLVSYNALIIRRTL